MRTRNTFLRRLVVLVFCYLILVAVGSIKGCTSIELPAPLTADERAKVQRARFDFTVGMERPGHQPSGDDATLMALRGTGLFKAVDYIDRLPSSPDVIVRGDTIGESIPVVPIVTIATLGVFPTWWKEKRGYEFSFHPPNSDLTWADVSFVHQGTTVLGWLSGFLNMSDDWAEHTSIHSQRLYDRLALELVVNENEIRRSVAKRAVQSQEHQQAEATQAVVSDLIRIPGKNYEIGQYEVTQGQWKAIMGDRPSAHKKCGYTCPVVGVSWNAAQEFIRKLNAQTGKQYRLPTEAEWEFACYGGRRSEYCGGDNLDAVGWYKGNSNDQPHPVGQKQANGYGLYDMTGNAGEWTNDCPDGDCAKRVMRGGDWVSEPESAHVAYRLWFDTDTQYSNFGFRLARTLQ